MAYRFDELGCVQFERLCFTLLEEALGVPTAEWRAGPSGVAILVPDGVPARELAGPTVAVLAWVRDHEATRERLRSAVQEALAEWPTVEARSVLVLTNVPEPAGADGPARV